MPSVCSTKPDHRPFPVNQAPLPATLQDDPSSVKLCLGVIDKKVRNLEKRKGKLDDYKQRVNEGQELIKDQKEALAKYEVVQQNLEFARDLQKQFQSMSLDLDKQQRKQLKREKMVKRQQETCRIVELLKLQTVLSSLKCTAVTKQLKDTPVVNDEGLKKLGDWSEFVTPAPLGHACFTEKLNSAA